LLINNMRIKKMKKFRLYNVITGWIVFTIATIVYLLTIEPTTSLWDCGEFIASAYKLEVGHPPGAPFFMLLARFFALFSFGNEEIVAMLINAMSAMASSFTILFLYWTITHLARKIVFRDESSYSPGNMIAVIGSGIVGALAYTFSDTFWFSAVEGEVYATSSLFTALVFWLILKWENEADKKYANRWIILIAYLMGLSIGVHLLNLLAIPAIVMVYYFRKYKVTRRGVLLALALSVVLLGVMMYGIIHGFVKFATLFELAFVNGFGLPYHSGLAFYLILIITLIIWGIRYTFRKRLVVWNTIITAIAVILVGYSSYTMLVIRSNADPPMDENDPENVFSLLSYLNREQYGDRPLLTGQYYNAPIEAVEEGKAIYIPKNGRYEVSYRKPDIEFDERFITFFPRMYSRESRHIREYKKWADIDGTPVRTTNRRGEPETVYKPTFGENLKFFFTYQIGFMYMRYFMWNFAGRQNDEQGHGGILKGNWITGISFLDSPRLGNQKNLPDSMKNDESRNVYYMLPLLLGIIGLLYHSSKQNKDFWVVMLLFLLTGIAILVYLNQTPLQPRERDYAYAGSFYAFAIWIGLGVLATYEALKKKIPDVVSAVTVTAVLLLLVPGLLAKENWRDHDRSGRYTARDFAYNYLNSCEPDAIIFTNGDNDTFPLWYAQEVEGIRTDTRVSNLMLLNTDWYIEQMRRKAYESEPLPITFEKDQYRQGTRDNVYLIDRMKEHVNLKDAIDFVKSDKPETKSLPNVRERIEYIPAKKFMLPVDSAFILEQGIVAAEQAKDIVPEIRWEIKGNSISKSDLMLLDILANNHWQRPIYFVAPREESTAGLNNYLRLDGFAYRLVPVYTRDKGILEKGNINTSILYDNLMNKFKWGRMNEPDVYLDHHTRRTISVMKIRNVFNQLAEALLDENKNDSAIQVLDKVVEVLPGEKVHYDLFTLGTISNYYRAGEADKGDRLLKAFADKTLDEFAYYISLDKKFTKQIDYEIRVSMQLLQEMKRIAGNYKRSEINDDITTRLELLQQKFQGMS